MLTPIPNGLREQVLQSTASLGQNNRCPGSTDHIGDKSAPYKPTPDYNCDPSQTLPGP